MPGTKKTVKPYPPISLRTHAAGQGMGGDAPIKSEEEGDPFVHSLYGKWIGNSRYGGALRIVETEKYSVRSAKHRAQIASRVPKSRSSTALWERLPLTKALPNLNRAFDRGRKAITAQKRGMVHMEERRDGTPDLANFYFGRRGKGNPSTGGVVRHRNNFTTRCTTGLWEQLLYNEIARSK